MIYSRRVQTVKGVNSNLLDGNHCIMFDVDDCNIRTLEQELVSLQEYYNLGRALIFSTGRADSYHVYFLNRVSWRQAVMVAVSCRYVDLKHIQFSLKRGHFTLRISSKKNRKIELVSVIESKHPSDITKEDFSSFVIYETASKLKTIDVN